MPLVEGSIVACTRVEMYSIDSITFHLEYIGPYRTLAAGGKELNREQDTN